MLETQIGQMAKQLAEQSKGGFSGNTKDNPKNETCNVIELRSRKVLTPLVPKAKKIVDEVVVEEVEITREVEKSSDEDVIEKENDQGVVENEKKEKIEGEKSEKLIDEDSILRKSKSQILKDGDKPQIVPSYVKLPYPHLAKKKKKEESQFKKFMELFSQLQVNIPFGEALDQMPTYAKFMKDLLTGRRKSKDDENIALSENCSAILQKKLPPKLKDPGAFTISCVHQTDRYWKSFMWLRGKYQLDAPLNDEEAWMWWTKANKNDPHFSWSVNLLSFWCSWGCASEN